MPGRIENKQYKQLTKNQSTFLNSLIKYNDAYFLEAKWMMARNSDDTKEQLAFLFAKIFSVHDQKIVWSTNLRIFMGNENAKRICERHFTALKNQEKTAEFFNFVCEYIQSSLLFNFDDVKAEKDFYEFFKLRMVMSIIAKDEGPNNNYHLNDYSTKLHRFVTTSDIFDLLDDDNFFDTFDKKMFVLAKIGFSRLFNQDYQAAIILIRLAQYVFSTLILASVASSLYYFVMGDTAMAALAGFCIAPLMLFETVVHGIGVKKQASIKENAKIEFQEISKKLNHSISVKLYKFIDDTGSKHVYHAVDVTPFEAPAALSQPTTIQASTSSQEHAMPTPSDPKPERVRPKSKYSKKPTPQTVVKTANARLFESLQKTYQRKFTEEDIINLPTNMKGILDRKALLDQKKLLDPSGKNEKLKEIKLKAIYDTFKTSNGRPLLESKGYEKNGIKSGFNTGYTCPVTRERKTSHSYIKNVSTGIRVHGSTYSTDEGNVIIYNIGARK